MFKDLDWGWALRRSGIVVLIYLVLMYVLSNVAPNSFGRELQTPAQWASLLPTAIVFFFVFTLVYAFIERSRRRRVEQMKSSSGSSGKKKSSNASDGNDDDADPGPLKGKPNPNMSRKKATRRRR